MSCQEDMSRCGVYGVALRPFRFQSRLLSKGWDPLILHLLRIAGVSEGQGVLVGKTIHSKRENHPMTISAATNKTSTSQPIRKASTAKEANHLNHLVGIL